MKNYREVYVIITIKTSFTKLQENDMCIDLFVICRIFSGTYQTLKKNKPKQYTQY